MGGFARGGISPISPLVFPPASTHKKGSDCEAIPAATLDILDLWDKFDACPQIYGDLTGKYSDLPGALLSRSAAAIPG